MERVASRDALFSLSPARSNGSCGSRIVSRPFLTARRAVRARAEGGTMDLKCSGIMSEDPTACRPSDVVVEAARLMKVNDVGSVPVVDNNQDRRLVGFLTDRDVAVRVVAEARDANTTMVEDVMTRD